MQNHFKTQYQTSIKAPIEKVWDALTNPEVVAAYFFGTQLITNWKVGRPIIFRGEWDGTAYEDKGIVLEFTPLQSLSYSYLSSWSGLPDLPENYLLVSYKTEAQEGETLLTVTQSNYDEEKAKHSEENWAALIGEMKKLIE